MKDCLLALQVWVCVSLSVAVCYCDKSSMFMQVDVIVSEWMGYALLFESMLDTVLYARDRSVSCCQSPTPRQALLLLVVPDVRKCNHL